MLLQTLFTSYIDAGPYLPGHTNSICVFREDVLVLSEGYDSFWSFAIACSFVITVAIVPFVLTIHSSRKLSLMQLIYYGD